MLRARRNVEARDIHPSGSILFERVEASHERKLQLQFFIRSERITQSGQCEVVACGNREA